VDLDIQVFYATVQETSEEHRTYSLLWMVCSQVFAVIANAK